jgi:hypothetical protein
VARSTLADANENRDWRIYAGFAHTLIATVRQLYAFEASGVDLDSSLFAIRKSKAVRVAFCICSTGSPA